MDTAMTAFTLQPERWYGWQMMPGYIGRFVPYCSPIFVRSVQPLKTGKGLLALSLVNAFYAEGVQDCELCLRILKRGESYLLAELQYGDASETRSAIVSELEFEWIRTFCPTLWAQQPPDRTEGDARYSPQSYLHEVFGGARVERDS